MFSISRYGDMPAHSFLWRECEKSSDNVAARLAVIPLVQVIYSFLTLTDRLPLLPTPNINHCGSNVFVVFIVAF